MAENEDGLAQHFRGGRKWWHFPVRVLKARQRDTPNMPKRQPCPSCGSWRKRQRVDAAGAFYRCRTHGVFYLASRDTSHLLRAVKR